MGTNSSTLKDGSTGNGGGTTATHHNNIPQQSAGNNTNNNQNDTPAAHDNNNTSQQLALVPSSHVNASTANSTQNTQTTAAASATTTTTTNDATNNNAPSAANISHTPPTQLQQLDNNTNNKLSSKKMKPNPTVESLQAYIGDLEKQHSTQSAKYKKDMDDWDKVVKDMQARQLENEQDVKKAAFYEDLLADATERRNKCTAEYMKKEVEWVNQYKAANKQLEDNLQTLEDYYKFELGISEKKAARLQEELDAARDNNANEVVASPSAVDELPPVDKDILSEYADKLSISNDEVATLRKRVLELTLAAENNAASPARPTTPRRIVFSNATPVVDNTELNEARARINELISRVAVLESTQSNTQEHMRDLISVHHEEQQNLWQRIYDGQDRNSQLMESNITQRHRIRQLMERNDIEGEVDHLLDCMVEHIVKHTDREKTAAAAQEAARASADEAERLRAELQEATRVAEQAKASADEAKRTINRLNSESLDLQQQLDNAKLALETVLPLNKAAQKEIDRLRTEITNNNNNNKQRMEVDTPTAQQSEATAREKTATIPPASPNIRSIRSSIIEQHNQSPNPGAASTSNPWSRFVPATPELAKALYDTFSPEEKALYSKFMVHFAELLKSYNEVSSTKKSDVNVDNNIQTVREKLHIMSIAIFSLCTGVVFESREMIRDINPKDFNYQLVDSKNRQAGEERDVDNSRKRIYDLYQRLCKELSVTQKDLGIVPMSKGLVYGDISWTNDFDIQVNCFHGTVALPNCAHVSGLQVGADAVVYLEKDNHNEIMVSTMDVRKSNYVFISGHGTNGPNERAMVKLAWEATGMKHPVLCIVDPNGSGYKMVELLEDAEITVEVMFKNETLKEYGVRESDKRATTSKDSKMIDNMIAKETSKVITKEMKHDTWGNLDQCLSLVNHSLGKIYLDVIDKWIKANESKWYLKQEQMEVEEK